MDHDLLPAAGGIAVKEKQKQHPAHQQEGEDDPQHVHEPLPLVPDQRDIGDAERRGEAQQEGRGQEDIVLGRAQQNVQNRNRPVLQRKADQLHGEVDLHDQHRQQEQGKAHVIDRIVGVGVILQLLEPGCHQLDQRRQQIDRDQHADGHRVLFRPAADQQEQNDPDEKRLDQQVIELGLFVSGIEFQQGRSFLTSSRKRRRPSGPSAASSRPVSPRAIILFFPW